MEDIDRDEAHNVNSLEVKAIDKTRRNHCFEVSAHISGKARVADSLDSGIGEACGKYCLEVSTHPSGKALEFSRSDGIIVWALELVWVGKLISQNPQIIQTSLMQPPAANHQMGWLRPTGKP